MIDEIGEALKFVVLQNQMIELTKQFNALLKLNDMLLDRVIEIEKKLQI